MSAPGSGPIPLTAPRGPDDELRVPFWTVLAGVGVGAAWALAGVLAGYRISRSRA
jgi:hypothetical protein